MMTVIEHIAFYAQLLGPGWRGTYRTFGIRKQSGGQRIIDAPDDTLKALQRLWLKRIYEATRRPVFAHGFERGRSVVTNARVHAGKRYVLNVDIAACFPSCRQRGRAGRWMKQLFQTLAGSTGSIQITPDPGHFRAPHNRDGLPQGAPTSPAIANRILDHVDCYIVRLLRDRVSSDCRYSRYADDITISSNSRAVLDAGFAIVDMVLRDAGFTINPKKTRRMGPGRRQDITGLVINSGRPTIPKAYRRRLRAMVHHAADQGCSDTQRQRLLGMIAHVARCHPDEAARLRLQLSDL